MPPKSKKNTQSKSLAIVKPLPASKQSGDKELGKLLELSFAAGYEQALKDQAAIDTAFDNYMDAAIESFEALLDEAEKPAKKAKKRKK